MSTAPTRFDGVMRRPFSSVNVRFVLRPRMLRLPEPGVPKKFPGLSCVVLLKKIGNCVTDSIRLPGAMRSSSSDAHGGDRRRRGKARGANARARNGNFLESIALTLRVCEIRREKPDESRGRGADMRSAQYRPTIGQPIKSVKLVHQRPPLRTDHSALSETNEHRCSDGGSSQAHSRFRSRVGALQILNAPETRTPTLAHSST